jgi:cation transport ATPase
MIDRLNFSELLVEMMPSDAHLLKNGETRDVAVQELQKDDVVLVKPGEKFRWTGKLLMVKATLMKACSRL